MDKDTIRVASIAMHSVMGDPSANLERVAEWAHKAHAQGADFGIFPEECITGSMNKSDLTFEEARQIAERQQRSRCHFWNPSLANYR